MELLKTEHFEYEDYYIDKMYYDTCIVTNKHPKISDEERQKILRPAGAELLRAWRRVQAAQPQ